MKETLEKAIESVSKLLQQVEDLRNVEFIGGVKPKFAPSQKVLVLNEDYIPSWYTMPVLSKSLEEGFKTENVSFICIGKRENLGFEGCGLGQDKNKIGVAYRFGWYRDRNIEESKIWGSLAEAVKFNQKKYNEEIKKYQKEQKDRKEQEKIRLQNKIKKLS